jgi:surface protein
MTFNEYYNFPEGTNASFLFPISFYDTVEPNFPCPANMSNAFYNYQGNSIPELDTSNVTNMGGMFNNCSNFISLDLSSWNTSKVTNMSFLFSSCKNLTSIIGIEDWDVSKVTTMQSLLYSCDKITSIDFMETWDTTNVTNMTDMFFKIQAIERIPAFRCDNLNMASYSGFFSYTELKNITSLGGFINLKCSLISDYNLKKLPNLNYQSCINVLNGLYDFTGNGETPNSNQGKLKVHSNFLTLVGDELSIGTNKGWTITA